MPSNTTTAPGEEEPDDAIEVEGEEVETPPEVGDSPTTAAVVKVAPESALMRPVASIEQTVEAFHAYQDMRERLLVPSDFQEAERGKFFVTKSGWRKLAVAMNVSTTTLARDYVRDEHGQVINAEVVVRAIGPNGRYEEGLGVCDAFERCCPRRIEGGKCSKGGRHKHCEPGCDGLHHFSKPAHDIPATAHTRAKNRALSDLFGFGEVSAEEVGGGGGGSEDYDAPADGADVKLLVATMNAIPNEQDRARVKIKFRDQFGLPHELKAGQIAGAKRFLTACGYNPDETKNVDAAPQAEPARSTAPERDSQGANAEAPSEPPSAETQGEASASTGGGGEGRQSQAPPEPSPPTDQPLATTHQKRSIAMKERELVAAGVLAEGDKAEIVGILTKGRARSTVEMHNDEAAKMVATLRLMESEDLGMYDDPDRAGARAIGAVTPKGETFVRDVLGAS